jgi:hypothetical protein
MAEVFEVELPDGTIIESVPEGTSQEELRSKLIGSGMYTEETFPTIAEPVSTPEAPTPAVETESLAEPSPQSTKGEGSLANAIFGPAFATELREDFIEPVFVDSVNSLASEFGPQFYEGIKNPPGS